MDVTDDIDLDAMSRAADEASALMKTLGHKGRLMILCQLVDGEKSVGELSERLAISQSPVSQHLARMRNEGLVTARRDAQSVYYSLASDEAGKIVECLYQLYCAR